MTSKGGATRAAILERAAMLASVDGLEQVSLARVAAAVGMSKSGIFAHFGAKQDLQLAVVEAAAAIFSAEVLRPALMAPRGLPRLLSVCRSFLGYVQRDVFPGGCFFAAAAVEYDARSGAVRERVAAQQVWWLETLERLAAEAVARGHLQPGAEPKQLAFELESLMFTANHLHKLDASFEALTRADRAITSLLARHATPEGRAGAGLVEVAG